MNDGVLRLQHPGPLEPGDIILMHFRTDLLQNLKNLSAAAYLTGMCIAPLEQYLPRRHPEWSSARDVMAPTVSGIPGAERCRRLTRTPPLPASVWRRCVGMRSLLIKAEGLPSPTVARTASWLDARGCCWCCR